MATNQLCASYVSPNRNIVGCLQMVANRSHFERGYANESVANAMSGQGDPAMRRSTDMHDGGTRDGGCWRTRRIGISLGHITLI